MEFFKIWKTSGGVIGVNRMSLGDLVGANLMVLFIYIGLLALTVQILPILLMGMYFILLLNDRVGKDTLYDTQQRLVVNMLTFVSVIYYLIDFHFGWLSFYIFSNVISKESFDSLAIINLSIGFINVILYLFGHSLYKTTATPFGRLCMFFLIGILTFRATKPISRYVVGNVITQCNSVDIIENRKQMDEQTTYITTDEEKERINAEQEQRDADKEIELKNFDKEYARKYLN